MVRQLAGFIKDSNLCKIFHLAFIHLRSKGCCSESSSYIIMNVLKIFIYILLYLVYEQIILTGKPQFIYRVIKIYLQFWTVFIQFSGKLVKHKSRIKMCPCTFSPCGRMLFCMLCSRKKMTLFSLFLADVWRFCFSLFI